MGISRRVENSFYIPSCAFTARYAQLSEAIQEYVRVRHELSVTGCCVPACTDGTPFSPGDTNFPPVFIGVSTEEVLFDDSIRMHEKLLKEGVDSRLVVWEGMWHTFYMMDFPESWTVVKQVSEFFAEIDNAL